MLPAVWVMGRANMRLPSGQRIIVRQNVRKLAGKITASALASDQVFRWVKLDGKTVIQIGSSPRDSKQDRGRSAQTSGAKK